VVTLRLLVGILSLFAGLVYLVSGIVYYEEIEVWNVLTFLLLAAVLISMGIFLITKRFFR
jgi:hypothetical protein